VHADDALAEKVPAEHVKQVVSLPRPGAFDPLAWVEPMPQLP
jgi:hypothetical protein